MLDRLALYVTADAFENSLLLARMSAAETEEHWDGAAGAYADLAPGTYPHLVAHPSVIAQATPEERFRVGLDALLDGIEAVLDPPR